jgi:hypothetical protein
LVVEFVIVGVVTEWSAGLTRLACGWSPWTHVSERLLDCWKVQMGHICVVDFTVVCKICPKLRLLAH